MRIATSIFLILIVSLVSFQEATFYAFFKLNQNYIAKHLCVEKEVKESKCKGNCRLKKMVEASKEAPAPDLPLPVFESKKIELFYISNNSTLRLSESSDKPIFNMTKYYDSDFAHSIFHPPIS